MSKFKAQCTLYHRIFLFAVLLTAVCSALLHACTGYFFVCLYWQLSLACVLAGKTKINLYSKTGEIILLLEEENPNF